MKRAVTGAVLGAILASAAQAQFPRLAPPPPCRADAPAVQTLLSYWTPGAERSSRPTLTIFPLQPEIDDPARVHLAVSLPDRVRSRLAASPNVLVAAEGSVSRATLAARELRDSAVAILKADYLLTGRITVSSGRQTVEVMMQRRGVTEPVWRATFQSTTSLRAMENAIVSGVSRALSAGNPTLIPAGWPTSDPAYEAVVAGDFYLRSPTRAGADSAIVMYARALELEPRSAIAASRLARAYLLLLQRGGAIPDAPGVAGTNRIFGLTTQALAADSTSSEAWTVRAMLARLLDPVAFEGAIPAHRRAVALAPDDAEAEHEFGITLMRLGDERGAEARFRRALVLEASRGSTLGALAELEIRGESWEAACALANGSIGAWPFDPMPYALRAQARLRLADARDAYSDSEMVRRLTTGAWTAALRVIISSGARNVDVARRQVRELTAAWIATEVPLSVRDAEYLALAYLSVGDRRRAVESLRRAEPLGADLGVALRNPRLAEIRSDTAVVRMIREITEKRAQGTR